MRSGIRSGWIATVAALVCLGAAGCGNNVSGHTYGTAGGGVTIEFQSGGKAVTSLGPMSSQCTYTQSGKQVSLVCEGDTTVLTIGDDGSLDGPRGWNAGPFDEGEVKEQGTVSREQGVGRQRVCGVCGTGGVGPPWRTRQQSCESESGPKWAAIYWTG